MVYDNRLSVLVDDEGIVSRPGYLIAKIRAGQNRVRRLRPARRFRQIRRRIPCQNAYAVLRAGSRSGKCQIDLPVILNHGRSFVYRKASLLPDILRYRYDAARTGELRRILLVNGCDKQSGRSAGKIRPDEIMFPIRLKICHIQRHGLQAVRNVPIHCFHKHRFSPAPGIHHIAFIITFNHERPDVKSRTCSRVQACCTDKIPGIPDLMKLRRPDESSQRTAGAFIPDRHFLRIRQTADGLRPAQHQTVVTLRIIAANHRIGRGKVVITVVFIVGNERVRPLLDQRRVRLRIEHRTADASMDGIGPGSGGIDPLQISLVPAYRQLARLSVRIRRCRFDIGLFQRLLDLRRRRVGRDGNALRQLALRCYSRILRIGEFLLQRLRFRLSQGNRRLPHGVRRTLGLREGVNNLLCAPELSKILRFDDKITGSGSREDLVGRLRHIVYAGKLPDTADPIQRIRSLVGVGDQILGIIQKDRIAFSLCRDHAEGCALRFAENLRGNIDVRRYIVVLCISLRYIHCGLRVQDGLVSAERLILTVVSLDRNLHAAHLPIRRTGADISKRIRALCKDF